MSDDFAVGVIIAMFIGLCFMWPDNREFAKWANQIKVDVLEGRHEKVEADIKKDLSIARVRELIDIAVRNGDLPMIKVLVAAGASLKRVVQKTQSQEVLTWAMAKDPKMKGYAYKRAAWDMGVREWLEL